MSNPWFRLYSEAVDDEKLRLLAFEDRWHYIALLCCKNNGILDDESPLMRRKVAVKLGLDSRELDEVARRLSEVGLIDKETFQPLAWDKRQFKSDKDNTAALRQKRFRDAQKRNALRNGDSNGDVTRPEQNTEEESEEESDSEEETHTEELDDKSETVCVPSPKPGIAGSYCQIMISKGIRGCSPSNPTLLVLINAGATEEEFADAARTAVSKGKPEFGYALGIVRKQREDAAKLILHRGPLPTKQEALEQENKESTQRAKARLFGLQTEKDITDETTRL